MALGGWSVSLLCGEAASELHLRCSVGSRPLWALENTHFMLGELRADLGKSQEWGVPRDSVYSVCSVVCRWSCTPKPVLRHWFCVVSCCHVSAITFSFLLLVFASPNHCTLLYLFSHLLFCFVFKCSQGWGEDAWPQNVPWWAVKRDFHPFRVLENRRDCPGRWDSGSRDQAFSPLCLAAAQLLPAWPAE